MRVLMLMMMMVLMMMGCGAQEGEPEVLHEGCLPQAAPLLEGVEPWFCDVGEEAMVCAWADQRARRQIHTVARYSAAGECRWVLEELHEAGGFDPDNPDTWTSCGASPSCATSKRWML